MSGGGSNKKVASITITNPGSGYTSAPTITFSGGGGSGAVATTTVSNGVIWITDGDLALDSNGVLQCTTCSTATGKGVTIIFTAGPANKIGAPTMQSNPTINNLSAPTSGTYSGLLMVQDTVSGASYTTTAKFQGTPGQTLNGLIYTPNSNLEFQGNPSVTNTRFGVFPAPTQVVPQVIDVPSAHSQLAGNGEEPLGNVNAGLKFPEFCMAFLMPVMQFVA